MVNAQLKKTGLPSCFNGPETEGFDKFTFDVLSANAFNLNKSNILSFFKGLMHLKVRKSQLRSTQHVFPSYL